MLTGSIGLTGLPAGSEMGYLVNKGEFPEALVGIGIGATLVYVIQD